MSTRYVRGQAALNAQVQQMLGEMAERLETHRPDEPLTPAARIAVIQATTMAPPLARALRAKAPEITEPVTRRTYAAQLREIAAGDSHVRSRAERVASLHEQCDQDYAAGAKQRGRNGSRDDVHLIAEASESAQARAGRDL